MGSSEPYWGWSCRGRVRRRKLVQRLARLGRELAACSVRFYKPLSLSVDGHEARPPLVLGPRAVVATELVCEARYGATDVLVMLSSGRGLVRLDGKPWWVIDFAHHYVPLPAGRHQVQVELESSGYLGMDPGYTLVLLAGHAGVDWLVYRAGLWLLFLSQLLEALGDNASQEELRRLEEWLAWLNPQPSPSQQAVFYAMVYGRLEPWSQRHPYELPLPTLAEAYTAVTEGLQRLVEGFDYGPTPRGLREAAEGIVEELPERVEGLLGGGVEGELFTVAYSHLDTAWLWGYTEARRRLVEQAAVMLWLWERYRLPFTLSASAYLEWLAVDEPELYERLVRAAREGGVVAVTGFWVEPDLWNTPDEALARNIAYGVRVLRDKLSLEPVAAWLPDCFGYPSSLPELLSSARLRVLVAYKQVWNDTSKPEQHTLAWRSPSGSMVVVDVIHTTYCENGTPASVYRYWRSYRQAGATGIHVYSYGFGDGGRPPTIEMAEAIELWRRLKSLPRPVHDAKRYAEKLWSARARLPAHTGDIQLEYHRGCQVTDTRTKTLVWRLYSLLQALDTLDAIAVAHARRPDRESLARLWRILFLSTFHDVVTGTMSHRARAEAWRTLEEGVAGATVILRERLGRGGTLTLVNSVPRPRRTLLPTTGKAVEEVPPLGYVAPTPRDLVEWKPRTMVEAGRTLAEAGGARIEVNGGRVLLCLSWLCTVAQLALHPDKPGDWDAWNTDEYTLDSRVELDPVEARATRLGVLLRYKGWWGWTHLHLALHPEEPTLRLHVWGRLSRGLQLRLRLRLPGKPTRVCHAVPYGVTCHEYPPQPQHYQQPFNPWVDVETASWSLAVASPITHAYTITENHLELPVARTPSYPDPVSSLDNFHTILAVVPHQGPYHTAAIPAWADNLAHPPAALHTSMEPGTRESLAAVEPDTIIARAKPAENTKAIVLRLYNPNPHPTEAVVKLAWKPYQVYEATLTEEVEKRLPVGEELHLELVPQQVKTLLIL